MSRNELHYLNKFHSREPVKNKEKLESQFKNWGRHLKLALDQVWGKTQEQYSGKKSGQKDDCALATLAAISYCLQSRNDPDMHKQYEKYRLKNF